MGNGDTVAAEVKASLDAANSTSDKIAVLHVAFMAVCAYVLVTVFGTTDLDLLLGKGIKLPVVGVDVPITGFYAVAPFIVLLVHFNLLLQLQLLSRKLYVFDGLVPKGEESDKTHGLLHSFPFSQYLVGRQGTIVSGLLSLMVTTTIIVLPLLTLFLLQTRFLAYQSAAITWSQRIAGWLDVAMILILWPLIVDRADCWRQYWEDVLRSYPSRWWFGLVALVLFGTVGFLLLGATIKDLQFSLDMGLVKKILPWVILAPLGLLFLNGSKAHIKKHRIILVALFSFTTFFLSSFPWLVKKFFHDSTWHISLVLLVLLILGSLMAAFTTLLWSANPQRGRMMQCIVILPLGFWIPFALMVDGEPLDTWINGEAPRDHTAFCEMITDVRMLNLSGQFLAASPVGAEVREKLADRKWHDVIKGIMPVNLEGRSLRKINLFEATLVGANLKNADFQGANLFEANLEGANLWDADLQGAVLRDADLQGADLTLADLQGAALARANLQGADLIGAHLQGAVLIGADLEGAKLWEAYLLGADLGDAKLQGAALIGAHLQGAALHFAKLQGAALIGAHLQGAALHFANLQGADLSGADLRGTDLGDADFQGVDLHGANVYGTTETKGDFIDARGVMFEPLTEEEARSLIETLKKISASWAKENYFLAEGSLKEGIQRIEEASRPNAAPLELQSCADEGSEGVHCKYRFNPADKKQLGQLHEQLINLTYASVDIARGIIRQIPKRDDDPESTRKGLAGKLVKKLDSGEKWPGLQGLDENEKKQLRDIAAEEEKQAKP